MTVTEDAHSFRQRIRRVVEREAPEYSQEVQDALVELMYEVAPAPGTFSVATLVRDVLRVSPQPQV